MPCWGKEKVVGEIKNCTSSGDADATVNVSDAKEAAVLVCAVTKMHGLMILICSAPSQFIFRDTSVQGSLVSSKGEAHRMLDVIVEHDFKVRTDAFHGLNEPLNAVELTNCSKIQGKPVILIDKEALNREEESGLEII
ncbi:MAG: hypothetical protein M1836_007252 [Candelina mexicana]|nr:MAG: hypothetical protein M1836_007252 [Candelina mexicana]